MKYKVFLIGNNDMENGINCVDNDLNAIAGLFQQYNYIVYQSKEKKKYDLASELKEYAKDLKKDDVLIVYYAGHSIQDNGFYLSICGNKINFQELIFNNIRDNIDVENVLFVLDSCVSENVFTNFPTKNNTFCAIASSPNDCYAYEMTNEEAKSLQLIAPLGFFTHFFITAVNELFLNVEQFSIQELGQNINSKILKYNNSKVPSTKIFCMNNNFMLKNNSLDYKKIQQSQQCIFQYNEYKDFNKENFFSDFLYYLHESFEHTLIKVEQYLNKTENLTDRDLRVELSKILYSIQKVLSTIIVDVSVNIKLAYKKNDDINIYLKAIARVPSTNEKKINIPDRSMDETFILTWEQKIEEIKKQAQNYTFKVNSAYNQAFLNNYWICNNLNESEIKGHYYSNSENYEKYYTSLAVFSIHTKNEKKFLSDIKGFLIFDSKHSGCFEVTNIKHLGAYFSHRLNRLFSHKKIKDLIENLSI